MSPPNYPTLKIGSFGDFVNMLQRALNAAPGLLPKIKVDSQFGPKTHGRVMEFQGQNHLVRDGVVGPVTWGRLEPFLKQLLGIVDQNFNASQDDEIQRQRIVDIAQASFESWGWGDKGTVTPDGSPRIAAARGYGTQQTASSRPRQGGVALASIYALANAGGANCLNIASDIEAIYQQDPKKTPGRREALNQRDIGSWCGIFATYCYRASGLQISWNDVKLQLPSCFESLAANVAVRKGDIGVYDPQTNHHFIVIADAAPGQHVYSIDGNVGNPSEQTVSPWNSVISTRYYRRATLAGKGAKFLRPKFAAMKDAR